jgi:hypothetical protein
VVRGCVDVWCVDVWMCGAWMCGCVVRGCVDVWCVDVWMCGCVDVWCVDVRSARCREVRGILDVAVLASWDATALDNFAAAAWATENDGVSALGPLDGELIKSVDGTPRLEDAGTGRLSEVQGADLEGRHVTHADVISDGSNNHGHLVSPVFHLFDEGLEGDGDFVGTAVVKSLQDNLVEP